MEPNAALVASAMPAVELITSADTGLTFDLAAMLLDVAREQFISDYERHGEAVAVYRLKQQVSHWSNQFAPELRGVARTIGNRMDGQTHRFQIAWSRLLHWHEQDQGETIAVNTAKKRARIWADAGGLEIIANDPYSPDGTGGRLRGHGPRAGHDKNGQRRGGPRMNGWDSSTFRVDFSRVIKGRRIYNEVTRKWHTEFYAAPHDFTRIGPESTPFEAQPPVGHAEESLLDPSMTPHCPLNDPSLTPYCSSPVPSPVPPTVLVTVSPAQPGPEGESVGREARQGERERHVSAGDDLQNRYIVRTWKSGSQAYARLDRASGLGTKGTFSDDVVQLSEAEARYMWTEWPAGDPQRKQKHVAYLLAPADERAALAGDGEADDDAVDAVAGYFARHQKMDLNAGVPGDLSGLSAGVIVSACEAIMEEHPGAELSGNRYSRVFWTTDKGRRHLAPYFPAATMRRVLADRRGKLYAPPWTIEELAEDVGLPTGKILDTLGELVADGYATHDGEYTYRQADVETA